MAGFILRRVEERLVGRSAPGAAVGVAEENPSEPAGNDPAIQLYSDRRYFSFVTGPQFLHHLRCESSTRKGFGTGCLAHLSH
jgi:hypothetical protein